MQARRCSRRWDRWQVVGFVVAAVQHTSRWSPRDPRTLPVPARRCRRPRPTTARWQARQRPALAAARLVWDPRSRRTTCTTNRTAAQQQQERRDTESKATVPAGKGISTLVQHRSMNRTLLVTVEPSRRPHCQHHLDQTSRHDVPSLQRPATAACARWRAGSSD